MLLYILRDISSLPAVSALLLISTSNQGAQPVPPQTATLHPHHQLGLYEVKEFHTVGREGETGNEREIKSMEIVLYSCSVMPCGWHSKKTSKTWCRMSHAHKICFNINAAPLSDLSSHSGFTTNTFQLPALFPSLKNKSTQSMNVCWT